MDSYTGLPYAGSLPLERAMITERPHDEPLGMPSAEALKMATDFIRLRYVMPETMDHPQVRSECMRLAYLIQAYGLAATPSPDEDAFPDQSKSRSAS
jgi:hypothetical protein